MNRQSRRKPWAFAHWVMIVFSAMALVLAVGCGTENPGGYGGGGISEGMGGKGAGDDAPPDTIPDTRWDLPGEAAQVVAPISNATACTLGAQCPTGNCVDGFCCDQKCDNKCMACSAAKKGGGVDGICGSIKYDTDPDNDCPLGACDGKNQCKDYNGVACTSTTQCLSNYCVDGYCCGNICMGECQACSAAKKGSGANGVCGNITAGTNPDNECVSGGTCNGSGTCSTSVTKQANGATCSSAAQCQSGYCADGVCCDSWCLGTCQACTAAKKTQGVDGVCGPIANDKDPDDECWGGACNGAGVCKQYNGLPCSDKAQCLSGYCVDGFCCGNLCSGMCSACSAARKGYGYDGVCQPIGSGKDPDNECNPGECNGTSACNQAQTPQVNGTTCVSSGQCASGNCVDGYCCDTACTETCKACSAVKKGSGANGACGPIALNTDPDNECTDGHCNGSGGCFKFNGGTCALSSDCMSTYCVDGFCCGASCTGTCLSCSAAKKGSGYNGQCGLIANNTDPDNECGLACNGSGACAKAGNGVACGANVDCTSGFCVDGVCCDNACTGICKACDVPGSVGTCSAACAGSCTGTIGLPIAGFTPITAPTGAGWFLSAMGDLNGDGIADLAVTSESTATVRLLYAVGDGGYTVMGDMAVGTSPQGVTIADLDADGDLDVAVTGRLSTIVSVFYNQGNGAFDPRVDYPTSAIPLAIVTANLNGDALPDLVIHHVDKAGVMINLGNRTFAPMVEYAITYLGDIGATDLNGDGLDEILGTTVIFNRLHVLMNQGNATFAPSVIYGIGSANNDSTITNGDLNGDGWKDLVFTGNANVRVMLNQGNGTLAPPVSYPTNYVANASALGDVDADGKLDVIISDSAAGAVSVLRNQGNGTLATAVDYSAIGGSVHAADLNMDGTTDIVTVSDRLEVLLNPGNGNFAPPVDVVPTASNAPGIVAADFSGDGQPDVGTGTGVLVNQANGTWGAEFAYPGGAAYSLVAAADFNSDGRVDIVGTWRQYANIGLNVHLNQGGASFGPAMGYNKYFDKVSPFIHAIVAADFNGDNKPDLALGITKPYKDKTCGMSCPGTCCWWDPAVPVEHYVALYINQGNGTLAAGNMYALGAPTTWYALNNVMPTLAAADFNGDGDLDLAYGNTSLSQIQILNNQGNASFTAGQILNNYNSYCANALAAGDVNGDGLPDLVGCGVRLNQGNATFAAPIGPLTESANLLVDLSGDGLPEMAKVGSPAHFMAWRNLGGGSFGPGTAYVTGGIPGGIASADFDGDTKLDFAIINTPSKTVRIMLNRCLP